MVRRLTRIGLSIALLVAVWSPAAAPAEQRARVGMSPEAFAAVMPRAFAGFFRWRSGGGLQTWLIQFDHVKSLGVTP